MSSAAPAVPLVSIVLPTHNGTRYLRQSVESCLGQTHRNVELVIVDDASTDATPQIVASFADSRIVSLRNHRNLGLPASLNVGFARTGGEYLTWTSDDNWYEPNALERMLDFLTERQARFVRCDYILHRADGEVPDQRVELPESARFETSNPVGACFLYHRSVREAVGGYDPEASLAEDYDYWIRAAQKFTLHRLAEPLYHYRHHPGSLSARRARDRGVRIAAALVRLKHRVTDMEREAGLLAEDLGWSRYRVRPLPFRTAGRLLRILSGGRVELAKPSLSGALSECRNILRGYADGQMPMAEAARRLSSLFATTGGA